MKSRYTSTSRVVLHAEEAQTVAQVPSLSHIINRLDVQENLGG